MIDLLAGTFHGSGKTGHRTMLPKFDGQSQLSSAGLKDKVYVLGQQQQPDDVEFSVLLSLFHTIGYKSPNSLPETCFYSVYTQSILHTTYTLWKIHKHFD